MHRTNVMAFGSPVCIGPSDEMRPFRFSFQAECKLFQPSCSLSLSLSLNPFPPPHSPYLIPPLHLSIYLPPLFSQFSPLSRTGSSSSCSILHHSISHPLLIPVLSSPATNWFSSSRSHFLTFVFLFSFLLLSLIFLHYTMSLLPLLSTPSFLLPLPLPNLFPHHKSLPLVSLLSSPLILFFVILFLYFKATLQTLLFLLASLTLSLQIDCLPLYLLLFSYSTYFFPLIVPPLHHFSLFIFHLAALPYFLSTGLSSLSLLFPPLSLPPFFLLTSTSFPFIFFSHPEFFFSGVHLFSFTFSFFSFFLYSSLPFQCP